MSKKLLTVFRHRHQQSPFETQKWRHASLPAHKTHSWLPACIAAWIRFAAGVFYY